MADPSERRGRLLHRSLAERSREPTTTAAAAVLQGRRHDLGRARGAVVDEDDQRDGDVWPALERRRACGGPAAPVVRRRPDRRRGTRRRPRPPPSSRPPGFARRSRTTPRAVAVGVRGGLAHLPADATGERGDPDDRRASRAAGSTVTSSVVRFPPGHLQRQSARAVAGAPRRRPRSPAAAQLARDVGDASPACAPATATSRSPASRPRARPRREPDCTDADDERLRRRCAARRRRRCTGPRARRCRRRSPPAGSGGPPVAERVEHPLDRGPSAGSPGPPGWAAWRCRAAASSSTPAGLAPAGLTGSAPAPEARPATYASSHQACRARTPRPQPRGLEKTPRESTDRRRRDSARPRSPSRGHLARGRSGSVR